MVYIDAVPDDASTSEHRFGTSDPARLAELREWEAELQREALAAASPGLRAAGTAMIEFMDSPLDSRGVPPDPAVPTSILLQVDPTAFDVPPIFGDDFVEAYIDRNIDRFTARVRANPRATLILVGESGHFIHRDRPELVTSALQWVLIRSSNPKYSVLTGNCCCAGRRGGGVSGTGSSVDSARRGSLPHR
jgi:pimeloyl-ACP methyl ester carboxylesterase